MDPFRPKAFIAATAVATVLAIHARRKKSLTPSGALAGFAVGFLLVNTGLRGMTLFAFYQIGSMATKFKKDLKAEKDATVMEASVRGATQVLAVSVLAVGLSIYHTLYFGAELPIDMIRYPDASRLTLAVLAHHSCCLADTMASELGILSKSKPILVTNPWKQVPPGTNGGITLLGTIWSILGGALMGIFTVAMDSISGIVSQPFSVVVYGALCGFVGSMLDSIIGATIQATYFDFDRKMVYHEKATGKLQHVAGLSILSNEQVNFASALLTTFFGGWLIAPILFN